MTDRPLRVPPGIGRRDDVHHLVATLAAGSGLDGRLPPFIGPYVLVLALGAPILAAQSSRLARLLQTR
jgi:K+:H+ antiporter subunit KhtU